MTKRLFLIFTVLALCGSALNRAFAGSLAEFKSGENQTHLLELFSSEGCSSCPPADAWLASLRGHSGLWKQFVPIEFHVDYWNRLGWTDPLSKSTFTERQQSYAGEWANSSVYTPGFVLDGSEWKPNGNVVALNAPSGSRVGVLSAKQTGKYSFYVTFTPSKSLSSARVNTALLGNGLESKVNSGENSGSVLRHEFAVLSLVQQKMEHENNRYTAVVEFRAPPGASAKSYSMAFWVTEGASQKAIQVVGGDL